MARKGKHLHNYRIAISGDMGESRSLTKIKTWIEHAGGEYSAKVKEGITHLVCSEDNWRRNVQAVREASQWQACKIVTWDWLEDCSINHRRHREGEYLCKRVFKTSAKERAERRKRERKELKKEGKPSVASSFLGYVERHFAESKEDEKECAKPTIERYTAWDRHYTNAGDGDEIVAAADTKIGHAATSSSLPSSAPSTPTPAPRNPVPPANTPVPSPENHHLYRDATGFVYGITLARLIIARNGNERYTLRLYESHTLPHTYAVHLRYASTNLASKPPEIKGSEGGEMACPVGSGFGEAFEVWKRVFREKTCQEWERREERVQGEVEGGRQFNYKVPKPGDPTGLRAPLGYGV